MLAPRSRSGAPTRGDDHRWDGAVVEHGVDQRPALARAEGAGGFRRGHHPLLAALPPPTHNRPGGGAGNPLAPERESLASCPAEGCTTSPAGLFTTSTWASSYTTCGAAQAQGARRSRLASEIPPGRGEPAGARRARRGRGRGRRGGGGVGEGGQALTSRGISSGLACMGGGSGSSMSMTSPPFTCAWGGARPASLGTLRLAAGFDLPECQQRGAALFRAPRDECGAVVAHGVRGLPHHVAVDDEEALLDRGGHLFGRGTRTSAQAPQRKGESTAHDGLGGAGAWGPPWLSR